MNAGKAKSEGTEDTFENPGRRRPAQKDDHATPEGVRTSGQSGGKDGSGTGKDGDDSPQSGDTSKGGSDRIDGGDGSTPTTDMPMDRGKPPDEKVPTPDEKLLGSNCLESFQPKIDLALLPRFQVTVPELPPKSTPESCTKDSALFALQWKRPPRQLNLDAKDFDDSKVTDEHLALSQSGTRVIDGFDAIYKGVQDAGAAAANAAAANLRPALEGVTTIYNDFRDLATGLIYGTTLATISGTVECPIFVCAGSTRRNLFIEHSQRIVRYTKGAGWYDPRITVSLDGRNELERLTIFPKIDSGDRSAPKVTCDAFDPPIPIPLPQFTRDDGYTSQQRSINEAHSTWDVIEVSSGAHTFVITYDIRIGLSGIVDDALLTKLLDAGCDLLKFQNKALQALRSLAAGDTGQGDGQGTNGDLSVIDQAAALVRPAAEAALSSLDVLVDLTDDFFGAYVARVAVPSSTLLVRCLNTNDIELVEEGVGRLRKKRLVPRSTAKGS